jgi:hypothetical protein
MAESMEEAIKELRETVIVMSGIQARQAQLLKDHAEWLAGHDKAMLEIREAGRKTDERIAKLGVETDERIAKLVSAIGEYIRQPKE